jgi:thioredoxin 1
MKIIACLLFILFIFGCNQPTWVAPLPTPPSPVVCTRVIAFTATWCGPCQKNKPALMKLRDSGVDVRIVDIDEQPALAKQFGIVSVPTYFVSVYGKQTVRTQNILTVIALTRI